MPSSDKRAREKSLAKLRREETACASCPGGKGITHYVFGEGNPDARVMFIGEAPGSKEDLCGRPFVGRAGKLLEQLLSGIGLSRDEVFITNVVKCRPMKDPDDPSRARNDRPPTETEVAACLPVLKRQITIISPDYLCTLGNSSLRALLGREMNIGAVHGKVLIYQNFPLIPTYHPAAVFRNPRFKDLLIADLNILKKHLKK